MRFSFFACLIVCLFTLGACERSSWKEYVDALTQKKTEQTPVPETKPKPSYIPKDEDAAWGMVEEEQPLDPLKQHLLARNEVDPNRISKKNKYTQNAKDIKARQEASFRALRLEQKMADAEQTALRDVKPQQKPVAKVAAPRAVYAPSVVDVRTGEHPGKTRIVLDVTKKTKYATRFVENGRVLMIDLPHATWDLKDTHTFRGHSLLRSYRIERKGQTGAVMVISFAKPTQIISRMALPGNKDNPNQRIVLDVRG